MFRKFLKFLSIFLLIITPAFLIASEKIKIDLGKWKLKNLKKLDYFDYNTIPSDYYLYYKIVVSNDKN